MATTSLTTRASRLGYSLAEQAADQNVEMALIEIWQGLIADQGGQKWAADIVDKVLHPLLDGTLVDS